jgi:hypothetical protein
MIHFGHRALDRAIAAFVAQERNHQGLGNNLITLDDAPQLLPSCRGLSRVLAAATRNRRHRCAVREGPETGGGVRKSAEFSALDRHRGDLWGQREADRSARPTSCTLRAGSFEHPISGFAWT